MVWPVHCVVDMWGHAIHVASQRWFEKTGHQVYTVRKRSNPYTEHYRTLKAEVPDPADPGTQ